MNADRPTLPTHVEETVHSVADLYAKHSRQASISQRAIERVISQLAQPVAVVLIALLIVLWIGTNMVLHRLHFVPFDPPPFQYLQGAVSAAALFMTVLILTSQRHENRLAERRAQLSLQLAMVSEQKIAKLIELVEHQRLDNPQIANRIDQEAAEMAKPADHDAILEAIQETRSKMVDDDSGAPS